MGYVDRAHSMHGRGDVFAAAVTLASGLKRTPEDEDALDWFLALYLEELPNPGLEREVLQVLALRKDGGERFDFLVAELEHLGREDKIDALELAMDRHRIVLPEVQAAPAPVATPDGPQEGGPAPERWDQFESPLEARNEPSGHVAAVLGDADSDAAERQLAWERSDAPPVRSDDGVGDDAMDDDAPFSVRHADPAEIPVNSDARGLPQMVLLGVALIVAAALMVWVAFSSAPPLAPIDGAAFESAGSGSAP